MAAAKKNKNNQFQAAVMPSNYGMPQGGDSQNGAQVNFGMPQGGQVRSDNQAAYTTAGQGANDALAHAQQTQASQNQNDGDDNDGGGGGGGNDTTPPYQGMFGLQQIMEGFYGMKPDSDIATALKGTFASNFIQGAADHLQAKDMAYTQQGIALTNMKAAANLEKENNAYMMADEYRYGLGTMDAQYQYTNNFANAQYDRDIGMLSAKGVDYRKTQDNASKNAMQEMVTAGQQQRLNTQLQGSFDVTRSNIAANASMYGADRSAQASMYGAQKGAEAQMYTAKETADASRYSSDRSAEASKYGSAAARDASMYGSDRSAQASMYGAAQQRDASMYSSDRSAQASMYGAAQQRDASMYGSDRSAQASMYGAAASRDATMYSADRQQQSSLYASDKNLEGTKYSADAAKTASMYGSDKQLEGIKDTNITSTRNIRTTGDETRKTNAQTNQFEIDREGRASTRSRAGARRY